VLFSALRALVVLLAFQLSGVSHAVGDLLLFTEDSMAEGHTDCPADEPGRDCPPGCPTCHHAHGGVGAVPGSASFPLSHIDSPQAVSFAPAEADAPPNPDLPSVFRPPKA
jgi:hypothetical protein